MTRRSPLLGTAIFGSFDGLTSVLGLVAALFLEPTHVLISGALGLAVASAVGMGAGQYLGDPDRAWGRALLMAASTLAGTVIPVVPFLLLPRWLAVVVGLALVTGFGEAVAWARRCENPDRTPAMTRTQTYAILYGATLLAVAVALVTGAA